MEAKILKLIKLIGEEVQIFETFLHYLNLQQDALVANNLEALQSVTRDQEELALRTTRVETERRALVEEICGELRRDHSDLTLSELTKLVAEPQSNQIQALQTTLLALHEQIATIKARNDFLIRKSMEYINTTIAQLGLTEQVNQTTYTADRTKAAPAAKTALVDRRA
ncbi:MAG: flagellar export chaperone FlgN [candidate division Zixibacteria bacterium]|nr:flagellar export chaperone FlgN [candidate division Zixibacteria bacterium]